MAKIRHDAKSIAFAKWSKWLEQKLKMPKRCEKRLYEHIRVVLCQKALQNTNNIREMTAKMAKIGHDAKASSLPLENGQFGSKIKHAKKVRKTIGTSTLELLWAKNRSKKHLMFEK